jgi:hypothetical protein
VVLAAKLDDYLDSKILDLSEDDSYYEKSSYGDEFTILDALDGDPENYWNID